MFLGSKYGNLIAVDAWQGKEVWQKMVGNWIDNTACIGEIDDEKVVYVSSHDYFLYVFKAENGDLLWKRALGGEVYSAPCFFYHGDRALVAAASLNNHLYIVDARKGDIVTSYFTGRPIWDKVAKGDTLWGSLCVLVISVFLPRFCFFLDFFNVIDFSIQALSSEHVQLYLSHVEPTPMLRSVHKSHNIADLLRRQGKYQESWEVWDEVYKAYKSKKHTAIKFQFADFFQYFGQVAHETIGDLNEAEKIYEEGLTLEPDHIGILTGLIDLYLEKVDVDVKNKTKAYWRAREVYNKAVGILKDLITKVQDTDFYRQLGELFLTMKEDEEAEKRLLSALERYGASAELLADLGVLYTRKGRFKVVSDYSDMQLVNYGKDDRILIQKCNKNTGRWESGYRFFRKSCGTALPFEMGDIL